MQYTVPSLFDAHVHFRQGTPLTTYVKHTARCCDDAIVMPNTEPPIEHATQIEAYRRSILAAAAGTTFNPLMVCYLCPDTTHEMITRAKEHGAVAYKLYPASATTHSTHGIPVSLLRQPTDRFQSLLRTMEACDLVLCLHGEMPDVFLLDRERAFVESDFLQMVFSVAPKLRVVLEHISTANGIRQVRRFRAAGHSIAGTITLHHMLLHIGDVVGMPDHFCRPCPALNTDRDEVRNAALGGESCFFLGSDSAPHGTESKYCSTCSAGIYTSPVLVEALFEQFHESGLTLDGHDTGFLTRFVRFTSTNGRTFYRLPDPMRVLTLVSKEWRVPTHLVVDGHKEPLQDFRVTPFLQGLKLGWQLLEGSAFPAEPQLVH
jgi:dihydroorotase